MQGQAASSGPASRSPALTLGLAVSWTRGHMLTDPQAPRGVREAARLPHPHPHPEQTRRRGSGPLCAIDFSSPPLTDGARFTPMNPC